VSPGGSANNGTRTWLSIATGCKSPRCLDNNSRAAFLFQNQSLTTVSVCPSPAAGFFLTNLDSRDRGRHLLGPLGNGFQVASYIEEAPRVDEADATVLFDYTRG
jgi:hypothetical protein